MDAATVVVDDLVAGVVAGRVITGADLVEAYRRDECTLIEPGVPAAVLVARSVTDVQHGLRWAAQHRVPVVPRGAGTGLAGGASALDGCLVLSLAEMTDVTIHPTDRLAEVGAGVVNAELSRQAAPHGLFFAPDPASFEISTIGGNIATNAGGLRCVKYGVTRAAVLGLEVVLADGSVIHTGGRTVKDVAGYDLTGLFVGSEGTLGVVTSATVRLTPLPQGGPVTVVAEFPTLESAARAVADVAASPVTPSLLELIDRATICAIEDHRSHGLDRSAEALLLCQVDGPGATTDGGVVERVFTHAGARSTALATDPEDGEMLLSARRLAHVAVEALGSTIVEDVGVSPSRLAELLRALDEVSDEHRVQIATVGHAGDGNMHPCIVFDPQDADERRRAFAAAEDVCRAAVSLGGTITGEHGIGQFKQPWLRHQLSPEATRVNHSIKHALDPDGILNPGRAC